MTTQYSRKCVHLDFFTAKVLNSDHTVLRLRETQLLIALDVCLDAIIHIVISKTLMSPRVKCTLPILAIIVPWCIKGKNNTPPDAAPSHLF
jgi:hypothetical protein